MQHQIASREDWLRVRRRMGWKFSFVSSFGSSFNRDFNVSFTPEQLAAGSACYNFRQTNPGMADLSGNSVFYKDENGQVFHTFSSFGRGGEATPGAYGILDMMPRGATRPGHIGLLPTGCGRTTCTAKAARSR
jgi:predicted dithiol-disulfide oxidoreductase (DUF899 family)